MSLLKRMANLIRSNVNDALDKAEDPRKILEQTILDMEQEHKNAKKRLVETLTMQKQAERQLDTLKKQSVDWESKAMAALKLGNEELARSALGEKQKADELTLEAEQGVMQQKSYTEELKKSLSQLEAKIQEAKGKRDELLARLSAAEMKKKQADIRSGVSAGNNAVSDSSAFDTFERMVAKIENNEAEIEARHELMGDNAAAGQVNAELDKLAQASSADAALEALKAKMSTSSGAAASAPAAAPASDDKSSAIDDELAKLRAKLEGNG